MINGDTWSSCLGQHLAFWDAGSEASPGGLTTKRDMVELDRRGHHLRAGEGAPDSQRLGKGTGSRA